VRERGREDDPREIGQHKDRSESVHARKGEQRGDDEAEEKKAIGESQSTAAPREEEPAPRCIADELRIRRPMASSSAPSSREVLQVLRSINRRPRYGRGTQLMPARFAQGGKLVIRPTDMAR